jgi:4-amino-4-deoxy-L-arabinose transferase-like glycosyltransferase
MKLETFKANNIPNKMGKAYHSILDFMTRFYIPLFIVLSGILFFLCFYRLDVKWVDSWDEARHGINAYEMYQNKNLVVNTYNYSNDYWNLKPPLSYWGIMLGFRLFGFSVFSLRFYSALCYFITCVVASLFVKRSSKLASLFTMAFFCASGLAFTSHMARAGDADALYTMFFTFSMLAMMLIPKNKKMLYVCGCCFAFAFLTKSWHSGMIVMIGGLYLLITGEIKTIKPKEWILFILSFAVPLLLWAVARFIADGPRFFTEMLYTDLLSRTTSAMEGHEFPFAFYYEHIFKGYYQQMDGTYTLIGSNALNGNYIYKTAMIICLIGTIYFSILFQKQYIKKFLGYLLWFFIPFIAFSFSLTKLIWYVYPTLIPLAMVAGTYTAKLLQSDQILYKVKLAFLLIVSVLLVRYTEANLTEVRTVSGDPFQSFIEESVTRDAAYAGANAYVLTNEGGNPLSMWTQANLFMGEISGDYRCMNGGVEAFLMDNKESVLYISKDYYESYKDKELTNCNILYETKAFVLITN